MREGALPVQPGETIGGKYRVEKILGQGGMAVVVAARHQELDELVAIKILLPHRAESPDVRARFAREARAAVKIKSEHVARVSDVGALDDGTPYIVMEYLDGEDLATLLSRRQKVPAIEAILYALHICDALREAHSLGIIHRDVKPANLFLARTRGRPPSIKVLDFGISKVERHDRRRTETKEILGSPWYMAPEQMQSATSADPRADIWSLGVILFELVTGEVPFDGETMTEVIVKVLHDELVEGRSDIPPPLQPVIRRCLAKNPEERYASIDELASALRALERPLAAEARASAPPRPTTPPPPQPESQQFARNEDIELVSEGNLPSGASTSSPASNPLRAQVTSALVQADDDDEGEMVDVMDLLPSENPPAAAPIMRTPAPRVSSTPPPPRISHTPVPPSRSGPAPSVPRVSASAPRPSAPPVPRASSPPAPRVSAVPVPSVQRTSTPPVPSVQRTSTPPVPSVQRTSTPPVPSVQRTSTPPVPSVQGTSTSPVLRASSTPAPAALVTRSSTPPPPSMQPERTTLPSAQPAAWSESEAPTRRVSPTPEATAAMDQPIAASTPTPVPPASARSRAARAARAASPHPASVAASTPPPVPSRSPSTPPPPVAEAAPSESPTPPSVEGPDAVVVDARTLPTERPPRPKPREAQKPNRLAFGFAIAALPIAMLAIILLSTREPQRARPAAPVGQPVVGETTVAQSPLAAIEAPTTKVAPTPTAEPTPPTLGPMPADERPVIIASVRTEPEVKMPPALPKAPPVEPKPESQATRPAAPRATPTPAPAPAAASPAGREDDSAVGFQVARRNHAGVKECWANSSKSTNVVTVAANVDASGSVTSASAKATDQGLAQCVEGKVRTWTFPAGAAGRSFNFPIRIGRN